MDDKQRIAMIETRNNVNDGSPAKLVRYQLTNHLGTACLETDVTGREISYEEYHPYGTTSYQAVDKDLKVAAKRYRYTGKERDEESGLYYHGARYYAAWLGRWTSCDPAGPIDGLNLFQFTQGNPVHLVDSDGRSSGDALPDPVKFGKEAENQLHNLHQFQSQLKETLPQIERQFMERWGGRGRAELDMLNQWTELQTLKNLEKQLPQFISELEKAKNMFGDPRVGGRAMTRIHLATRDMLTSILQFQMLVLSLSLAFTPTVAGILAHEGAKAAGVENPLLLGLISLGVSIGAASASLSLLRSTPTQIFTKTNDFSKILSSGRVWGQTEGSVWGMTSENASRWRTWIGSKTRDPGTLIFEGNAAKLFRPHPDEGWFSGIKRLLGQQKAGFGDIVFEESSMTLLPNNTLVIREAALATHAGQSTEMALMRLWGRRLAIEPAPIAVGYGTYELLSPRKETNTK